jgi:hypothetical protein
MKNSKVIPTNIGTTESVELLFVNDSVRQLEEST